METTDYTIQVAARRSGLTPDVIRVWERRYKAVEPIRAGNNRRRYSDKEIERLFLLAQATRAGHRIGDIANRPTEELAELIADDRRAESRVDALQSSPQSRPIEERLERLLTALRGLDGVELELQLEDAALALTAPRLVDELIAPLMRRIGEGWREGTLRPAHEHLATSTIRSLLTRIQFRQRSDPNARELIVATPPGQRHDLGALAVALSAGLEGWRTTFLGGDLPIEDLVSAALQRRVRAVALSITYPADDAALSSDLQQLRRLTEAGIDVIVGGGAAHAYSATMVDIGALLVGNLQQFRDTLQSLRTPA